MATVVVRLLGSDVLVCGCEKCGAVWVAEGPADEVPMRCARGVCKSRAWNGSRLGAAKTAQMAGKLDVVSAIQSGKAGTGKASTLTYEPVD